MSWERASTVIAIGLLSAGPLALFAQQLPSSSAINLLQGAYAPSAGRGFDWRAWRVAAILLACLLGLHVAGKTAELHLLKKHEHQVDASIRDTLRSVLPSEANSAEPRRRRRTAASLAGTCAGARCDTGRQRPGGQLP